MDAVGGLSLICLHELSGVPRLTFENLELPRTVVALARVDARHEADLFAPERALVANSVAKRRREFATGRFIARQAMRALQLAPAAIPRLSHRAPAFPAALTGSISHCHDVAAALVSQDWWSVGCDIECTGRLRRRTVLSILTEWEQAQALALQEPLATLVFSAKEAVYKAAHPLTLSPAEFKDVEIVLELERSRFSVRHVGPEGPNRIMNRIVGHFAVADGHVLTLSFLDRR